MIDQHEQEITTDQLRRAFEIYRASVEMMDVARNEREMKHRGLYGIAVENDEWALSWQAAKWKADWATKYILGDMWKVPHFAEVVERAYRRASDEGVG